VLCTRDGQCYTDAGIKALHARTMAAAMDTQWGPPVITDRFRMQDIRPKGVSDVGGGKRGEGSRRPPHAGHHRSRLRSRHVQAREADAMKGQR
jgi:hypothetical protein